MHQIFETSSSVPEDPDELNEYFLQLLDEAPPNLTVVIFLNGLHNFHGDPGGMPASNVWIPNKLPENVKIIASCVDTDHGRKILKELRKAKVPKDQFEEVHPLDVDTSKMMIKTWMNNSRRKLTPQQWRAVDEVLHEGCSPMYMKFLREHILTWTSSTSDLDLPATPEEFIAHIIDTLQQRHGKNLVTTVLGMLIITKNGVTETEAEDMLSLDESVSYNGKIFLKDLKPFISFPEHNLTLPCKLHQNGILYHIKILYHALHYANNNFKSLDKNNWCFFINFHK